MAIQLFGQDPEIMRSAAARSPRAGADLIDLNMGCPVPKVLQDRRGRRAARATPTRAVAVARAAREGSGLPVTVKLRAGRKPGGARGLDVAHRLVEEAGVAGITFHPRSAAVHHKGTPDYDLAERARRGAPGAGDRLRRDATTPTHIRWVLRAHRRRGGDARPRRARQPVAVRPGARASATRSRRARRCSTSSTG